MNCFPSSRQLKKIKSYFCHSFESGGSFFMLPTYIVCILLLELILLNFVAIFYCYNNQYQNDVDYQVAKVLATNHERLSILV